MTTDFSDPRAVAEFMTTALRTLIELHASEYRDVPYDPAKNPFEPRVGYKVPLGLVDYIERLFTKAAMMDRNKEVMFEMCNLEIYLIDSVAKNTGGEWRATEGSVYRLIFTAFMYYIKFWSDEYWTMGYYARVFGVGEMELRQLEKIFGLAIGFSVPTHVDPDYLKNRSSL